MVRGKPYSKRDVWEKAKELLVDCYEQSGSSATKDSVRSDGSDFLNDVNIRADKLRNEPVSVAARSKA